MVWLFLLCLLIGIYFIVRTIVRSAFNTGRVIVAPQNEEQRETRSKLWWSLGLPISIAVGIFFIAVIGTGVYEAFHPDQTQTTASVRATSSPAPQSATSPASRLDEAKNVRGDEPQEDAPLDDDPHSQAAQALRDNPDVHPQTIAPGNIMLLHAYGPCGTIQRSGNIYFWNGPAGITQFEDFYRAIAAALPECEVQFKTLRFAREQNKIQREIDSQQK